MLVLSSNEPVQPQWILLPKSNEELDALLQHAEEIREKERQRPPPTLQATDPNKKVDSAVSSPTHPARRHNVA